MDFWHSLGGMVSICVTSADIAKDINCIQDMQITLYQLTQNEDPLTVTFQIQRNDFRKFKYLAKKRGISWKITNRNGVYWQLKGFIKRPVLMVGIVLLLILITFLPTRVFFFQVEGNSKIPTKLILEKCQSCGLTFGASRETVRSEKVKNALLESIPQLQWAGVNTSGCVATISVRERSEQQAISKPIGIGSIVSSRDGVITKITATKGNTVCSIGQAVRKGQVLISGYTDCGISIRGEIAEGEIYALTHRNLTVVFASDFRERGKVLRREQKYSLIIGKKRINFYKGSGISPSSCVKMYSEKYVTLPGGFQLPIAFVTEEWTYYDEVELAVTEVTAAEILSASAQQYLHSQMIAGECIHQKQSIDMIDGAYILSGKYSCTEMIGILQNEELVKTK